MTDKIIFLLFILGLISFFVWFVGYLTKRIKPSNRDDYSGGGDAGADYGAHYDSSFGDGHSGDDGGHHWSWKLIVETIRGDFLWVSGPKKK